MIYRLGMIGLWDHTSYTLAPLPQMKNVKLVACACTEPTLIQSHRKRYPFFDDSVKIYSDFHEMLDKEALDITAIYTTHGRRPEAVIAAAQAGAHIFAEKPLAPNLIDLARIYESVSSAEVQLSMMLAMRFEGVYRKVHELVREGVLGEIAQASSQKSYKIGDRPEWMKNRGTFAGTIPYIACHSLDLIRWTTGLEFVKGAAFHNNIGRPGLGCMENSAGIILKADNGATLSSRLDYCRPEIAPSWGDDRLRIAGLDGVVEVMQNKINLITKDKQPHEVQLSESIAPFQNFLDAIEGRVEPILSADDCFRITEIVLKLRDAADAEAMVLL
ncbi:MAG: Gfo/Idh/MocA family protein [Candidatus Hinthialibacter sp.]